MLIENKKKYIAVFIYLCGLILGSVGLLINSVGIFFKVVSEQLNLLSGTFIFHNTLSSLTMAFCAVFISKILTEKNFKSVLWFGVLLSSLSTIAMGFSKTIIQFYILGIVRGIGMSCFSLVIVSKLINNWFNKSNGTITSFIFAFSGVGGAIFSPLLSVIIEKMSWQIGYCVMGVMVFVFALPALLCKFTLSPEAMGLLPYGGLEEKPVAQETKKETKTIISKEFVLVALFSLFCHLTGSIMQHLSTISIEKGYTLAIGSIVVSASMIGNIVSKMTIGTIADKIGAVKANIIMISINILATIFLIFAVNYAMLVAGGLLFGSIYAETAVGIVLITRYVFGKERFDSVFPLFLLIGNGSFAIATTLVGYLYDFTSTYNYALCIGLVLMSLCIVFVVMLKKNNQS